MGDTNRACDWSDSPRAVLGTKCDVYDFRVKLHCKKYLYIHGYFAASFPYFNRFCKKNIENLPQNIRRYTDIFSVFSSVSFATAFTANATHSQTSSVVDWRSALWSIHTARHDATRRSSCRVGRYALAIRKSTTKSPEIWISVQFGSIGRPQRERRTAERCPVCLLYTSDAADDLLCVDLGGRRIIKNPTTP